jgi:hypothetical protein
MKTLTSHLRRPLPAILVISILAFAAAAQTTPSIDQYPNEHQAESHDLQLTWLERAGSTNPRPATPISYINNQTATQASANFNVSGAGKATIFDAKTQFNINGTRILSLTAAPAKPSDTVQPTFAVIAIRNIFVGLDAGFNNRFGADNSFLGFQAGFSSNGGSGNSFFGSNAGFSNIGGHDNSFMGIKAGFSNQSGYWNSFVGKEAGLSNTTGYGNSFFGTSAGLDNLNGYANSFFGVSAGRSNKSGLHNSFFGTNAGSSLKTGYSNTAIGSFSDIKDGLNYATAIGAGAWAGTNNTIVLGRDYDVNGTTKGPDTVLIYGSLQLQKLNPGSGTALCRDPNSTPPNQIVNCSASSLRYKKNVAPFSPGLSLLQRLKPIRFEWKEGGMKDVGFGAEDIAADEPLLATYNEKGEVEGVKYDRISTVLVNAVKEQQAQIEAQQQQLKDQQTQLEKQQVMIEGLKKLLCGQNPEAEVCKR